MRKILFVVLALGLVSVSKVNASETEKSKEQIIGQKDFSEAYLESVKDERAVAAEASRQAREEHDRYLRQTARSGR